MTPEIASDEEIQEAKDDVEFILDRLDEAVEAIEDDHTEVAETKLEQAADRLDEELVEIAEDVLEAKELVADDPEAAKRDIEDISFAIEAASSIVFAAAEALGGE